MIYDGPAQRVRPHFVDARELARIGNSQAGGARRIAVGTALALTDYPWSLARLAAAEIADGAR